MWQPRPAWWHAARRMGQYQAALIEIANEVRSGRCWRSALSELEQLRELAVADRLHLTKDRDAPASAVWDCETTWPAVLGALDGLENVIEAAQRGVQRTEGGGHVLTPIPISDFAAPPPAA
jgi:hypothetical protein